MITPQNHQFPECDLRFILDKYFSTQRELERRQTMLDQLITKEKQLDQALKNERPDFGGR